MEYTKGCNTPVKNACKSTNMLQLLKFSFCFYQISMNIEHIVLTNRIFFVFGIATFSRVNYVTNVAPKIKNKLLVILVNPFSKADQGYFN
jgi:hypothetical protein